MAVIHCPTCDKLFDSEKTPAMPFCSERCRLLDLQGWLDEEHGMPYEGEHDVPDNEPGSS